MPVHAPRFSVVIPTTRPHLLRFSLASVLAQTMTDFEVIISYNMPEGVPDLDWLPPDPRIRYLRPPQQLTQFNNWDFVCQAAQGEWMALLGDDDVLVPQALEIALAAAAANPDIKMMSWQWGRFVADDWPEPHICGLAGIPPFSGATTRIKSADFLTKLYGMRSADQSYMKKYLPSIMRGAYRKDLRDQLMDRIGHICMEWTPDYAAASLAMTYCTDFLSLDLPLVIMGGTTDSMAAIYSGRPEVYQANFVASGKPEYRFTRVQAKVHSRPLIAETVMMMRERAPERLGRYEFNILNFLEWHYDGLLERRLVADVSGALEEFWAVVEELTADQKAILGPRLAEVERKRKHVRPPEEPRLGWKQRLKELALAWPILRPIAARTIAQRGVDVHWRHIGVDNIAQFAAVAGRVIALNKGLRLK